MPETISPPDLDLSWLPAWRIRELVGRREISPIEVTEHFLARIEAMEPEIRAFRQLDRAGARDQARRAERAVLAGDPLGPLHGVPIAFKEHLAVNGMLWHDLGTDEKSVATWDSVEAERMRAAGAIVFGAVIAQGANTNPEIEPRNAWDTARTPGGSSLGGAAATAAGMLPVAICTDGRGSTRLPAAFTGTIGIRGTRGRVPVVHRGTINPHLLTDIGPIARDMRDIAILLQALAGPDGRDLACLTSPPPDYAALLGRDAAGLRLGWTDDFGYAARYAMPETPEVIATIRAAAFRAKEAGATIEPIADIWDDPDFATNAVHAVTPVLSDRIRQRIREGMPADAGLRAQDSRQRIWTTFMHALDRFDFILSPTIHFVAPRVEDWLALFRQPGFMASYTAYTSAANLLGWPAISIPAGFVNGLPVSLQIMGKPDSEPKMLQLADAMLRVLQPDMQPCD